MSERLTAREEQIREYLCLGWQAKEIGIALGISHRTVEDHRANILDKYRVKNVVELVRKVYRIGEYA